MTAHSFHGANINIRNVKSIRGSNSAYESPEKGSVHIENVKDWVEFSSRDDLYILSVGSVDASSVHGNIFISGVNDDIFAKTSRGNIKINDAHGSVLAASETFGDIDVHVESLAVNKQICLSTTYGNNILHILSPVNTQVHLSTLHGKNSSDFFALPELAQGLSKEFFAKNGFSDSTIKLTTKHGDNFLKVTPENDDE